MPTKTNKRLHKKTHVRARDAISQAALPSLRRHLDALVSEFDYCAHVRRDPLHFVRCYQDPRDAEVAGLVAACLAYGRVGRVLTSVESALVPLGPHPAAFLRNLEAEEINLFDRFIHRFTGAPELRALCTALGRTLRRYDSLEAVFVEGLQRGSATGVHDGLQHLVNVLRREMPQTRTHDPAHWRRIRFLLPAPKEGSACKRLNMWLRWMVRRQDGLDLGLWNALTPAQLLIPLDAHVVRLARTLHLTTRSTVNWTMAEDVTTQLRRLDPVDPIKYDFAFSHLGMQGVFLPGGGPLEPR